MGGTWRVNTYPGADCDVPSQLYSFSFAPNPGWTRTFSPQAEIRAYPSGRRATPGCSTASGSASRCSARVGRRRSPVAGAHLGGRPDLSTLINATGGLSAAQATRHRRHRDLRRRGVPHRPVGPPVDLAGKRVAVIGTGASAVQMVPAIAPVAGRLDVYQRSAPWVLPKGDRAFTDKERRLFRRFPSTQKALRARMYWFHEALVPGITRQQRLNAPVERLGRMTPRPRREGPRPARAVAPDVRRRSASGSCSPTTTTPRCRPPTSRSSPTRSRGSRPPAWSPPTASNAPSMCSSWRPASTPPTRRSASSSAVATGARSPRPGPRRGMAAYKGCAVHGFPNLLSALGPNTGQGHTSVLLYIEAPPATSATRSAPCGEQRLGAVEPRADVQARWNAVSSAG